MTILSGDIKLLASKIMDDVPNGGGGPTGNALPDGASNAVFSDVTERQRAVGGVSIRQLFGAVQTPTTDAYMDPTVVLSQLPNDPNVSITLAKTSMFAKRTEIANAIENYLIKSSEWGGYLLENHVAGQRSIQLIQRPGMPTPAIGRTLVLVQSEGLPAQVMQYVRITKVEVTQRTFTYSTGGGLVDYVADVLDCTLSDVLRSNFAGSPPSRYYTRDPAKTVVRDTTVADAATFYGAAALSTVGSIGDSLLRVSSVYTQLVPSARTESAALDQKPAAQRTLTLAQTPRLIEVGITPHTMRIRVGQENRGFSWVQMLKPRPAPGTVVISYMALGNWYTLMDDGAGGFTGSGVGQIIYTTGSLSITLPSIPDAGTSIIFQWGENTAYTSRAGQAGYRAPEFAWALPQAPVKPGSVVVTWTSGGVLKTATDNGTGGFTSASASGEINYPAGKIFLRPTAMIDPGGEFSVEYKYTTVRTENITNSTVDAGGFAALTLQAVPAPRSVRIDWVTVRNVSESAGTSDFVSSNDTEKNALTVTATQTVYEPDPPQPGPPTTPPSGPGWAANRVLPYIIEPGGTWASGTIAHRAAPGATVHMALQTTTEMGNGAFRWVLVRVSGGSLESAFPVLSGTVYVTNHAGFFDIPTLLTTPADTFYNVRVEQELGGSFVAISEDTQVVDVQEVAEAEPLPTYTTHQIAGFYQATLAPGENRYVSFTGPVPTGSYLWDIDTTSPGNFDATSGSFPVSKGDGGFWVKAKPTAAPGSIFSVVVRKQDGAVLAKVGSLDIVLNYAQTQEKIPQSAIKVRDPVSTYAVGDGIAASAAVYGMFAGGVDGNGKTVFVAVPPGLSNVWGEVYDPPASDSALWTVAEMASKAKPLQSASGYQTTYKIWGYN